MKYCNNLNLCDLDVHTNNVVLFFLHQMTDVPNIISLLEN